MTDEELRETILLRIEQDPGLRSVDLPLGTEDQLNRQLQKLRKAGLIKFTGRGIERGWYPVTQPVTDSDSVTPRNPADSG